MLPVPTKRELVAARESAGPDRWLLLAWHRGGRAQGLGEGGGHGGAGRGEAPGLRAASWIEGYDVQRGTWIALIDSSIVSNAASGEPPRCPDAGAALALLRRALGEHLTRW
ncbi:hypothetical protein [Kitasatospora sp. NPDC056531]|uniref:hypothetical protein n=1 Tax=Kitasatospora sp. NPDC056531 TaxID=3345856 RepID=UPI003689D53E